MMELHDRVAVCPAIKALSVTGRAGALLTYLLSLLLSYFSLCLLLRHILLVYIYMI